MNVEKQRLGFVVVVTMMRDVCPRSKEPKALNLILLWMMVLNELKNEKEKALLKKDLQMAGCHGLLERIWCLHNEKKMRELTIAKSSEWNRTLTKELNQWSFNI